MQEAQLLDQQISKEKVSEYYSQDVKKTSDLKTTACCSRPEKRIVNILKEIHPEIIERYYGCGSPIPECLEGLTVLDLGCGTGRDCYILSKLVGETGQVIGIDMTQEQLDCANKYVDYHTQKFGFSKPNVTFHKGVIEDLKTAGIKDNSIDLVVSNCVVNLSPYKDLVLSEIFRVLKPGGELYFSDVFADRRLSKEMKQDKDIVGECLGGALYIEDFRRLLLKLGVSDFRVTKQSPIEITDKVISEKLGLVNFTSKTIRAFKIAELEDKCEDYGQVAYYNGTIEGNPNYFDLDDHHRLEKNKPMLICSNTYQMLKSTRFSEHFTVHGDLSTHYGIFPCGQPTQSDTKQMSGSGGCC